MKAKVYAFLGKNQASIDIPVSNAGAIHVEFTGGNVFNHNGYALATSKMIFDETIQAIIENSPYFGKQIIEYSSREIENGEGESKPLEIKAYPGISSFADAVAVLKADFGLKATQLRSPAAVLKIAREVGASFPDWEIE